MSAYKTALVQVKISKGGFANERFFSIVTGEKDIQSTALFVYFFNKRKERIKEDECTTLSDGYIEARVVNGNEAHARIWLPDGEVIYVPRENLEYLENIPLRREIKTDDFVKS